MDALAAANHGHAIAYGERHVDTEQLTDVMRERFGAPVEVFPVWGGTGANVVSLACLAAGERRGDLYAIRRTSTSTKPAHRSAWPAPS